MSAPTVLDHILAAHRQAAAADGRRLDDLVAAAGSAPPPRPFLHALGGGRSEAGMAVIAEVKRRSPSKGDLAPGLRAGVLAESYQEAGAAALSVLTDRQYFGGSPIDLTEARRACDLPVLRKDFTVDERDVCDARLMGADAVLLIVAALSDPELGRFRALAADLGMAALVEVHDERELARALDADADLIGVNQRDLRTFEVDRARAARLAPLIPSGIVKVAESGITAAADVADLAATGYDAVLVGERLVTSAHPGDALRALKGGAG